ncbi:hypothetical protein PsorP6_006558 [Peronosclerospora sorghi]|uniref:Uncharacterized protein n=1 Tax=Peronosclerospora sorghi TaxID=230839 RepID=A0ACC0W1L7_9STRA|nr:hypothetical protein PsorP6_006558 [Peronosclerospora sorghi]
MRGLLLITKEPVEMNDTVMMVLETALQENYSKICSKILQRFGLPQQTEYQHLMQQMTTRFEKYIAHFTHT